MGPADANRAALGDSLEDARGVKRFDGDHLRSLGSTPEIAQRCLRERSDADLDRTDGDSGDSQPIKLFVELPKECRVAVANPARDGFVPRPARVADQEGGPSAGLARTRDRILVVSNDDDLGTDVFETAPS
jgi:hypothetical protein